MFINHTLFTKYTALQLEIRPILTELSSSGNGLNEQEFCSNDSIFIAQAFLYL